MDFIDKEPGIYYDVPFDEYRRWKGVSKSSFHHILKSGLHYRHYLEKGEEEKPVMVFGNLVDTLLFEPDLFSKRYAVIPEIYPAVVNNETIDKPWNWNATYCKVWRESKKDYTVVSQQDIEKAHKIRDNTIKHPTASKWLDGASVQVSMVWIDPETGVRCKGRADALKEDRLIDLKITNDCHPKSFSRTMYNFLYHAQGAFYHDGELLAKGEPLPESIIKPFSFIVAEDSEPHDVVCYNLGMESFEIGRIVYRQALERYKEMRESKEYYGYSNIEEEIDIPRYAINAYQYQGEI